MYIINVVYKRISRKMEESENPQAIVITYKQLTLKANNI